MCSCVRYMEILDIMYVACAKTCYYTMLYPHPYGLPFLKFPSTYQVFLFMSLLFCNLPVGDYMTVHLRCIPIL